MRKGGRGAEVLLELKRNRPSLPRVSLLFTLHCDTTLTHAIDTVLEEEIIEFVLSTVESFECIQ